MGQDDFTQALLDAARPRPNGLSDGHGKSADKRFDVYRNNVAVSLTEALKTAFPVVQALVGEDFFHAMAGVFIRQHPPSTPLMMFYGADFPEFLETFAPAQSVPYLADVARIELGVRQAYHARDTKALDAEALATLAPEELEEVHFDLAPPVRLFRTDYPVGSIWRANMMGGPVSVGAAEDIVVSRPKYDPMVDVAPPGTLSFLGAIDCGTPFGAAASGVTQPDFDLSATLSLCLTRGLLTLPRPLDD